MKTINYNNLGRLTLSLKGDTEAFMFLGCYVMWCVLVVLIPMFHDSLLVPPSRITLGLTGCSVTLLTNIINKV